MIYNISLARINLLCKIALGGLALTHKIPFLGAEERQCSVTQMLGHLQGLWEDYVKSLLCFIWSRVNLSCIGWYKSTSSGNVLTAGLLATRGSFPNQVLTIRLKLEWKILPSKHFAETVVFPTKISSSERSAFSVKKKKKVVGKFLTSTRAEHC